MIKELSDMSEFGATTEEIKEGMKNSYHEVIGKGFKHCYYFLDLDCEIMTLGIDYPINDRLIKTAITDIISCYKEEDRFFDEYNFGRGLIEIGSAHLIDSDHQTWLNYSNDGTHSKFQLKEIEIQLGEIDMFFLSLYDANNSDEVEEFINKINDYRILLS